MYSYQTVLSHEGDGVATRSPKTMGRIYLRIMLALLCTLPACNIHAEEVDALYVWTKDGQKVGYLLTEAPKARFTESALEFTVGGEQVSYPLDDYLKFTFGKYDPDAVEAIPGMKAVFHMEGDNLHVSLMKASESIRIYGVDGKLISQTKTDGEGQAVLPVRGSGIFIVSTNSINFIISKR